MKPSALIPALCAPLFPLMMGSACGSPCASNAPKIAPPLTMEPWVELNEDGKATLLFETQRPTAIPVFVGGEDCGTEVPVTLEEREIGFAWPPNPAGFDHPDLIGSHVLHRVAFENLEPGQTVTWTLQLSRQSTRTGSFTIPAPGKGFRFGFIADTSVPHQGPLFQKMAEFEPDLVLHGGDIQYISGPGDTWSKTWEDLVPLTSQAPFQAAYGNHEHELITEHDEMWVRLLGTQGDPDDSPDHHAFTYGSVRFIAANSEGDMAKMKGVESGWLRKELQYANDKGLTPIVFFHQPTYTLASHAPKLGIRAVTHPLFQHHQVPLVLNGHNHVYERFLVDGITYIVDGGGGASLYDIDANSDSYPQDALVRFSNHKDYGFTIVDVGDDGSIELHRHDLTGAEQDRWTVRPGTP